MYVVKISSGNQILDVLHYEKFENVFAAIADGTIFREGIIPADVIKLLTKPYKVTLYSGSESDGIADDFIFRFDNDIQIYVGTAFIKDKASRSKR